MIIRSLPRKERHAEEITKFLDHAASTCDQVMQTSDIYFIKFLLQSKGHYHRLLGAILSIGPLLQAVLLLLKFGWKKTFSKKERPLPPKTLLDPRWGEHRYIHLPNLRMHYVEKGDKEKTLMVFLHGFPEFWYSWRYQMEHFSKNYWYVVLHLFSNIKNLTCFLQVRSP